MLRIAMQKDIHPLFVINKQTHLTPSWSLLFWNSKSRAPYLIQRALLLQLSPSVPLQTPFFHLIYSSLHPSILVTSASRTRKSSVAGIVICNHGRRYRMRLHGFGWAVSAQACERALPQGWQCRGPRHHAQDRQQVRWQRQHLVRFIRRHRHPVKVE